MDHVFFASLAGNALLAIGGLVLAAKSRVLREIADDLREDNAGLGLENHGLRKEATQLAGTVNAMRSDATLGRKTRLQRDAALRKAMAVNSARKAEKAALANAVN